MEKEGAIKQEERTEQRLKALEVAAKHSPDLNKLQRVVIDRSTTIYVGKDQDPKEAKRKWVEKMQNRKYDIRYKNYDLSEDDEG